MMRAAHSLREHSSHTLLLRFLMSTYSAGRHLMKLLRHLMQCTVHSCVFVLLQTGQLLFFRSSQQMQSPWKTCPHVSRTDPPLASQMLQRLVSLILTVECCHVSALSSSSEASGVSRSSDSMLVGRSVYLARQSWTLKMVQTTMAVTSSPETTQRMMRRADSTQRQVSQLVSYHPQQVRHSVQELVTASTSDQVSHSTQLSSAHTCACAATSSTNNSSASLMPIRKRYILPSNSVRIHKAGEQQGYRQAIVSYMVLSRSLSDIRMVIARLIKELEMKKEVVDPIALEVKSLSKTYRNISRENIRILHQFCQFDYRRTNRVVCMANDMKNPISIIEAIIKKPELSEEMLADLERKYQKHYGQEVEAQLGVEKEEEAMEKVEQAGPGYDLFEAVPSDCILRTMEFLDPYSFVAFSRSCQRHHKLGKSQALGDYYKSLCVKVFRAGPVALPNECRFGCIRAYVEQHPNQYGPNTRNAVANNLRRWVWRMELGEVACEPSFLKSFGSYQALFLRCPRIHFNGYYVCRQKYVRIGQKNEKYPVAPIHVVYYYRYFRFLPDGSVLYHVRGKRIKQNEILTFLSKAYLDGEHPQTMVGQFLQDRDLLFVKTVRNNTVFTYELQIRSEEGRVSNELKIHRYTLELVDDHQDIKQILYVSKPDHEDKVFQYSHNTIIAEENPPAVAAASL